MSRWGAVLALAACSQTVEDHRAALNARVQIDCGERDITCDPAPPRAELACLERARDGGAVARLIQDARTTDRFYDVVTVFVADHVVWEFVSPAEGTGAPPAEHACLGPLAIHAHERCFYIAAYGCP
jgi:hypothetical protein